MQDIVPTTMELAVIEKPDIVRFRSLIPMTKGETKQHAPSIYGAYLKLWRMAIKNNMKLIVYLTVEEKLLCDLRNDPLEMNNLADAPEQPATIEMLREELFKLRKGTGAH